ncbi:MAG TPA: Maf family protein [Anaeromyxobacteraceae bacterium]|nr:Maf family protein [Anaeromyxobacteraceae bacterium]
MPVLTLASQSPRRRELLGGLGIPLEVRPAHTDETPLPGEAPAAYARRVAVEKARAVHGDLVLAADTTVAVDGQILGKPAGPADAARMLRLLSGRRHEVISAVCVRRPAVRLEVDAVASTEVEVAPLDERVIAWYVATGEPLDKAGAYAVQGLFGAFVRAVRGSVTNVIGLPLDETLALLRRVGYALPWDAP